MLSNKKILITGVAGFIGACLAHRLIEYGCKPDLIIRGQSNLWRIKDILPKVNLHYADLTDKDGIEKIISKIRPEIIYHCATYGGYPYQADLDKIIHTDIIGTINLLEACLKYKFNCFVNTGTSSEYGIKKQPIKESDLLEPVNTYGAAKASATLFCQAVARKDKLPIATLRLFSPYGYYEAQERLIPSVIIACLNKKNPKLSSAHFVRDFVFIDDVVDAYIKVAENQDVIQGEIFNIGSGNQCSVGEIVNMIIRLIPTAVNPQWGSVPNLRIEPISWVADISKVKAIINWQPKYDLIQGLEKTAAWIERNISLYKDTIV